MDFTALYWVRPAATEEHGSVSAVLQLWAIPPGIFFCGGTLCDDPKCLSNHPVAAEEWESDCSQICAVA